MVLLRHYLVFYLLDLIENKPFMLSPCVIKRFRISRTNDIKIADHSNKKEQSLF
ncbi:hypothetical protein XNW1_990007 [Xenorhabdus nematophila str. Websteri]|nr:hypothetical protein XNA1_1300007 [Xenorhabdus nematophila str. Anatoliense]CEF32437.1 hypothetical protein XNW1_4340007 [Xenorhabdus nematophila str. Websteri]CEF34361.1 hypothetical protein XNW1_990007 [Xenorhabdus nematophila str. Websteri]